MQFKQTLLRLAFLLCPVIVFSQSTFLPRGDKQQILLERLEIKAQKDSVLNFSKTRPFSRSKYVMNGAKSYQETYGEEALSKTDVHNLRSLYMNNAEWFTEEERTVYASKKPVLKHFYTTPPNLYETHSPDFDLVINPVFQYTLSKQNDNDDHLFQNTRGITLRGKIADKIGFAAYVTDNQERPASYVQQWIGERQAVPGNGYYKGFKAAGGVDYFDARGYITFGATKYVDITFGYDKNFIGNGYRSVLLSDFGTNNLFLKLNTRIWKFNYQNLFMELHQAYRRSGDRLLGKKYAAMHHLDFSPAKWLNIGLFEGVIFGRTNHFEFGYLVPVIFYRSIEHQNGSSDNAIAGMDFKANVAKRFQAYGQLLLDEFKLSEIKANKGWWGNKWAYQLGAKYIDAFGIKNFDLQLEHNRARPFTYSHRDSVANYTHYNQPLAHPLMANFKELIGIARYQPAPKWLIEAKAILYTQGRDSAAMGSPDFRSFGSNIFLPHTPEYRDGQDYGYHIGSGWKNRVAYASLLLSYEWRENFYLDLNAVIRRQEGLTRPAFEDNSSILTFGIRWNMNRREFDF